MSNKTFSTASYQQSNHSLSLPTIRISNFVWSHWTIWRSDRLFITSQLLQQRSPRLNLRSVIAVRAIALGFSDITKAKNPDFRPTSPTVGLVERFSLLQFPQFKNIEPTFGRQLLPPGLRVRRSRSFEWLATFSQGVGTNRAEIAVERRIGEKPRRGQRVEGAIAATSLHRPHQNPTPLVSERFRVNRPRVAMELKPALNAEVR